MQKKISRKDRLLALVLAFTMVFTSMSSSIAMALDGKVTKSTEFTFTDSGYKSTNYHFELECEYGKTWYGTCMDPDDQQIPSVGDTVDMSKVAGTEMIAKIAYAGTQRTDLSVPQRRYIISRAVALHLNRIDSYSMQEDVDKLLTTAKTTTVPEKFFVYKSAKSDYGQQILAWRNVTPTIIKVKKTIEESDSGKTYSLKGAEYGLYDTEADAKSDKNRLATMTTDKNGDASVTLYFIGKETYFVKEITAPANLGLDETVHKRGTKNPLKEGQTWTVNSEEPLLEGGIKVQKSTTVDPIPEGFSLAGAVYGVYDSEDDANSDTNRKKTLTTKENGITNKVTLPPGTYYVKEISCPDWLELDPEPHPAEIVCAQTEPLVIKSVDIVKRIPVQVIKSSDPQKLPDKYNLAGITYGVYPSEDDAEDNTNRSATLTTEANGESNEASLYPGTYYVKEIFCPDWLEYDDRIQPVTLTYGQTEIGKVYFTNKVKLAKVTLKKSTTATTSDKYSLAGAKYGIYDSEADANNDTNRRYTLTTEADGTTNTVSLEFGTYYVKEYYCPDWLEKDETPHKVTLDPGESETVYSTDLPKPAYLQVIKSRSSASDYTLAGAEYTVTNSDGDVMGVLVIQDNNKSKVLKVPANDTYYIEETKAPAHYQKDKTVHEEFIPYGNHSSADPIEIKSVDDPNPGWIQIFKTAKIKDGVPYSKSDYSVEGAKYGIFSTKADADSKDESLALDILTIKSDGKSEKSKDLLPGTYYVKELTAPANMEIDTETHKVEVISDDTTTENSVEIISTGWAKVKKVAASESYVLSECPQNYSLAGAEYKIYKDEQSAKYEVEENRVATLVTDADGNTPEVELTVGDYWIIETKASPGFKKDGQPPTKITIKRNDVTTHTSEEPPMVDPITILLDKEPGNDKANKPSLAGAVFKVEYYTKVATNLSELSGESVHRTWYFNTKEETYNGEVKGVIRLLDDYLDPIKNTQPLYKDDAGHPAGMIGSYVITEETAPKGYVKDSTPILTTVDNTGTASNPEITYTKKTNINDPKEFRLKLIKQDSETGNTAQGDATLAGAVFGLYRDGKLVKKYTTGTDYTFTTPYHNIGDGSQKYTVREISPPEGYLPHTTEYKLSELEGDTITVQYTTLERTVKNDVIKGNIALVKIRNAQANTGALTPEPDIKFEIYLKSAGSYANAKASEKQTITTDADGFAQTKDLPYGVYTVHQANTTAGHDRIKDFDVFIKQDGKTYRYTLNNDETDRPVKVYKKDAETGKIIPAAGVKFKVRKAGSSEWIGFTVLYPQTHIQDVFETDASGTFQLPGTLGYGSYELVEQSAPAGYVLSSKPVPFEVDGSQDLVQVTKEDMPQKGLINVVKTGETLKKVIENADGSYTPVFGDSNLKGAVFEIRAKEDIVTPDGTTRYTKGQLVDTITTGNNGIATTKALYLGKYEVKETKAPVNHVLNTKTYTVELVYAGQNVEITSADKTIDNERQKVKVTLKKNLETDALYGYASDRYKDIVFGIRAEKAITAEDGSSIPKNGLIQTIGVSKDGSAYKGTFTCDLPHGSFYVQEEKTSEGYILDGGKYPVTFSYSDQNVSVVNIAANGGTAIENKIIRGDIEGRKISETDVTLKNALMGLFMPDETEFTESTALLTDTSDENGVFEFKDVAYGKYIVREIKAPMGYALNTTSYPVSVKTDKQVIKLDVVNEITKFDIAKTDIATGDYVIGAQLAVIPLDSEGNPDPAQTFVTWITGDKEFRVEGLEVGKTYILRETLRGEAWDYGYVTAEDIKFTVPDTGEVQKLEMKDDFTKVDISKTDITTGEPVVGAQLAIIPLNIFGLPKLGETFETWITDDKEHRVERIPVGEYILRETLTGQAWDYGYVTAEDVKFTVSDTPKVQKVEMKDDYTKVEITKTDIATGEPVIGAQLSIIPLDEEGNPDAGAAFETWITEEDPHYIERIPVGKYILRETLTGLAWDYGYVTAEDVVFEVKDAPEIQYVNMEDDFTKLEITKTDITTGEPVIGAQLSIIPLDEDGNPDVGAAFDTWITAEDPHYIERIPVGEYILRETLTGQAWDYGYVTAEDVKFTVKDTPEVQHVEMNDDYSKVEIMKVDMQTGEPVIGTQLSLIPLKDNGKPDAGAAFDTWITDDKAHYMEYVPVGEYIIRETLTGLAWDYGYVTAEDLKITVKDSDKIQTFEMKDDFTKIEITKTDITTREPVVGAQLSIIPLDKNGKPDVGAVFDTWITGEKPHYIERIPVGEYILREKLSGDAWDCGYVTAEDVKFTVADTPDVQHVEMNDDYTKIDFSKTDITTGKPVIGAQLSIYPVDENGNVSEKPVREWTTGEKPHRVEYLPVGDYVLREVLADAAQYGYVTAEEVKFTVTDTMEIQKVEMKDDFTKLEITKADSVTNTGIPDTELSLFAVNANGEVAEKATAGGTTDKDGKLYFEYVPVGDYILRETGTNFGLGYVTASDVPLKVMDTALVQAVTMKDDHTKVEITKSDITTGEPVIGAELSIYPQNEDGTVSGNPFTTWTTTGEPHLVEYIPAGNYVLREVLADAADAGYVTAEEVPFTVSDTGEIQKVEMKDDFTKVEILKTDIETGEPISGAALQILTEDGTVVREFVSSEAAYETTYLPVGDYILRETKAPAGYVKAEDMKFTVTDTAEVQKFELKNDFIKVAILKKDSENKKVLPGAKLQLLDQDGNIVATWISGEEAEQFDRLAAGTYTLKELDAPKGYEKAEPMKLTVKETAEVQEFIMLDDRIIVPEPVDTGDNNNPFAWITVALLGIGAFIAGIRRREEM